MQDQANRAQAVEQGPLSPGALKILKIAIVAMGIAIVIGVVLVIGRIVYLVSKSDTLSRPVPGAGHSQLQPSIHLAIPAGASIEHVTLDGQRIAVTFKDGAQYSIAILNLETGGKITEIKLTGKPPAAGGIPQGE